MQKEYRDNFPKPEPKIDTKEERVDPVSMVDILEKSKIQTDKFWKDIKDWDGFEKKQGLKMPIFTICDILLLQF